MATSPATAPEAAPSIEAFPLASASPEIQASVAPAVATSVLVKAIRNLRKATPVAGTGMMGLTIQLVSRICADKIYNCAALPLVVVCKEQKAFLKSRKAMSSMVLMLVRGMRRLVSRCRCPSRVRSPHRSLLVLSFQLSIQRRPHHPDHRQ